MSYSIRFLKRDDEGNESYLEFPIDLLKTFEDLTEDSSLKQFIERWQISLDTMIEHDKASEGSQ